MNMPWIPDQLRPEGAFPAHIIIDSLRAHQLAFDHMNQGIVLVDTDGRIPLANRQAINLIGLPPEKMDSRPALREIVEIQWNAGEYGPDGSYVAPEVRRMIKAASNGTDLFSNLAVYERTRPNGVVIEVRTTPLPGGGIVRTYTDISERKRAEALIEHMARHDSLTGLANRRHFLDRLRSHLNRLGTACVVLLLDLDKFKPVNDTLGHQAGDAVLERVAQRLRLIARDNDTIARLGGDEFALICPDVADRRIGIEMAERILELLMLPIEIGEHRITIGASIGISLAPFDGTKPEELLRKADLALYRAKSSGRHGFCCFDSEADADVAKQTALGELTRAAAA
jgi:diguanylate cyclase (GGDEF)-like protein